MATKVKTGMYAGCPIQFSDGAVSKALGWNSYDDITGDARPVVLDLADRMYKDHDPVTADELLHDVENLEYVHIAHGEVSLGHVFHKSELEDC